MKILHVYKTYLPDSIGGVEKVIEQLVLDSVHYNIESEVLSLSSNVKGCVTKEINGYKVHRCETNFTISSTPFSLLAFSRFKSLAASFDIIHYHFPYPPPPPLHTHLAQRLRLLT